MTDYKNTLNLPKTDFPMKANLPQQAAHWLPKWEAMQLTQQIREARRGRKRFVLHDGPPYANGHLHCGHALNKILKDIVVKSQTLSGIDAPFLPGWDCHGLPIELNVEKKWGKAGDKLDAQAFRAACRAYASSQIDIQRQEFKQLGVLGAWDRPYCTMDFHYEADIIRSVGRLIDEGFIYQGLKPVHWCVSCGSALAEAEVDYQEKQSLAIDVAFTLLNSQAWLQQQGYAGPEKPVILPIWTTTPWTLPANEAVCLHPDESYGLYETPSAYYILSCALATEALTRYGQAVIAPALTVPGHAVSNLKCQHPFLDKQVPVIVGKHVTTDAGSGCVHTAPAHGVEDYDVAREWGISTDTPVLPNGCYASTVPFFAGMFVLKANEAVIEKLEETGTLVAKALCLHSYPHCWRHKTPMIFLATPQWFISMTHAQLRERLLAAIQEVTFIPAWGRIRMENMIKSKPDWCISRQRNWGTPIALFIHRETRALHPETTHLIKKVADLVEKQGLEAWFALDPKDFLGEAAADYEKVTDTLDVWFDAGLSHAIVLKKQAALGYPADLYLEGSDQYRGWFNASLTTAIALGQVPPYRTVLSHGYTVDGKGKKLSKSAGNYVELGQVLQQHGTDLIRLWVASTDYRHEVSLSNEILTRLGDVYRRIRNTARFLLANLWDFNPQQSLVSPADMVALDRYLLAYTQKLQGEIIEAYEAYQFHLVYQKIQHFCSIDLGSFYLDIIKDRQYTMGKDSVARRSCQSAIYWILSALVRWIAPILSFTAEEIWSFMPGQRASSVFLVEWETHWPLVKAEDFKQWHCLQSIREEVNQALELARAAKHIGSGLGAEVVLYAEAALQAPLSTLGEELRFFLITSAATVDTLAAAPDAEMLYTSQILGLKVKVTPSPHEKCVRCWHRSPAVGQIAHHPELCERCAETVSGNLVERCYA